jgi:hypothetical protein
LQEFARTDLPRDWLAWALCYAVASRETRSEAVRQLYGSTDEVFRAFFEQLRLLRDEDRRRALLAPVFPPSDTGRMEIFSRLLKLRCSLPGETLVWLLDWLGALSRSVADFWCRDDHLGHLVELLREAGEGTPVIWERLCKRIDRDVLLPGSLYQQTLLANLAADRDRPGSVLPPAVAEAVADWVLLREHFEKAAAVPDEARPAIIDACNRRGLDPMEILPGYFTRFVLPHGLKREVLDDFAGFYHSFCPAGTEHQDHASRVIGWLHIVAGCPDEATTAAYQQYYFEQYVPIDFRQRIAEEMHQAGKLLRVVYEAVPRLTRPGELPSGLAGPGRAGDSVGLFQLTGVTAGEDQPSGRRLATLQRLPWLLCSLAGGVLAAYVCGLHRARLQHMIGLAMYVPVVLALAETMAVQAASFGLGALRRHKDQTRALVRNLARELLAGLLLGTGCGLVVGLLTAVLGWPVRFALCLAVTAAGGGAAAALVGLAVPALLSLPGWGQRISVGPVARAGAGVLALLVYFTLARWLLG